MAILPEGLGHDEVANDQKHYKGDDEQGGKSEEMACVFEVTHRAKCPSGSTGPGTAAYGGQAEPIRTAETIDTGRKMKLYVTVGTDVWCWVGAEEVTMNKGGAEAEDFGGLDLGAGWTVYR
jgi:hypothetical protein